VLLVIFSSILSSPDRCPSVAARLDGVHFVEVLEDVVSTGVVEQAIARLGFL
jgi:hypothetical protein